MKRLWAVLLLIPLCTACAAVLPGEERAFAVALAISGGAGDWTLHARIPTYNGEGYATVSASGDTLGHAWAALDGASPLMLHAGQMRLIIVAAETAASGDFPDLLVFLAARTDMKPGAALCVTRSDMSAVMEALRPATGKRLSKALDALIETRIRQGVAPRCTLADMLTAGERHAPVLMNLTAEGEEIVLEGGWAMGDQGRVAAFLTPAETQLLALMQGRMKQGTLLLREGAVGLNGASARVKLGDDLRSASVWLTLQCDATPLAQDVIFRAAAEDAVALLDRLCAAGCDVLGLARQAVMRVSSAEEWRSLTWPAHCREIRWTVFAGAGG